VRDIPPVANPMMGDDVHDPIDSAFAPFVLQTSLGDFAVSYELNAYCDDPRRMGRLYTAMHQNVLDIFNEHGVQIMTPAYEGDPGAPKIVPKEQWYLSPAKPAQRVG